MRLRAQYTRGDRRHRVIFMMTPFSDDYSSIQSAVRDVVERLWSCQLFLASERKFEDRILESVQHHMDQADAFIAEVTDANPNVMFELGAAFSDRRGRPIVQLVNSSQRPPESRNTLPADLQGMIYLDYGKINAASVAHYLDTEMRRDVRIAALLEEPREHYVSASELSELFGGMVPLAACARIVEEIPTKEAWSKVTAARLKPLLGKNSDLHEGLLTRVQRGLGEGNP